MMPTELSSEEKQILLRIARQSMESAVRREAIPRLDLDSLPLNLREFGASFVTLTSHNHLRGCIGALDPYQPLAEDVREHAMRAAMNDFRFHPVQPDELSAISIEISHLTLPDRLEYDDPAHLLEKLRPGIDGVVIQDGARRATFLPQVWEKIHQPAEFLSQLCQKMGSPPDLWRRKHLDVFVYQVEEFRE
jgi:uncharacterized protein